VTDNFNSTSSFSQVQLNIAPYTYRPDVSTYVVIRAKRLFKLDRLELTEENKNSIYFIRNCTQYTWPPILTEPITKHLCFLEISRRIFVPLCEDVILEKTYARYLDTLGPAAAGLKALPIGCGSFQTWHGSPDARVRGTEVVYNNITGDETEELCFDTNVEENCDSDSSNGRTITVEAKMKCNKHNLPQLVSTCVVSSFTEKKLHSNLPSIVPSILIDLTSFRVCFYDCNCDLLLISEPKLLTSDKKRALSRSGTLLLWLTINHR